MTLPDTPPPLRPAQRGKVPLFVERDTYRRRRLKDAGRLLPVLALMLWMAPLLWSLPDTPIPSSRALIYLFATWLALVALGAVIAFRLARRDRVNLSAGAEDGGPR